MDEQLAHDVRKHLNAAIAQLKQAEHYATVRYDARRIHTIIEYAMGEVERWTPPTIPENPQG